MAHTVYAMWTVGTSSTSLLSYSPAVRNMLEHQRCATARLECSCSCPTFKTSRLVSTSDPIYSSNTKDETAHTVNTHQYLDLIYR